MKLHAFMNDRGRVLVEQGPEAKRNLYRRGVTRLLIGLGAVVGYQWAHDSWIGVVLMIVIGFLIAQAASIPAEVANAYRVGWLEGRARMVEQMRKHQQRGNSHHEWLRTELEHDAVNVIGMPVVIRDEYEAES